MNEYILSSTHSFIHSLNMDNKTYKVIGLMSGSSLDGLDIAYCEFQVAPKAAQPILSWKLIQAETLAYPEKWVARLTHLPVQDGKTLIRTHVYFGRYMAELVNAFIKKHKLQPDLIASHGHTVFHEPERMMTLQIGDGAALAALTGIPVACDFRTHDIALEGEGTPIAPAADRYLFSGYDFYLNIGGIANVTCNANGKFIAFDTSPANQMLNLLANEMGLAYDIGGQIARKGTLDADILFRLNELAYFKADYPKSLDNNWIREHVFPIFNTDAIPIADKLHTATQFIATQLGDSLQNIIQKEGLKQESYRMLVTGGGGFNDYLMECIGEVCKATNTSVVLPEKEIIDYKEAILMALMGVLRMEHIPNCFSSVTGAKRDTIGGAVYLGTGLLGY